MTTQQQPSGWGNATDKDLVIPRIKLVQPQTQDPGGAALGQYMNTLTGDAYDEIVFVPLVVQKCRSLFPRGEERPVCFSKDGVRPHENIEEPFNDLCDSCPQAQWEGRGKGAKPPACKDQIDVMALMLDGDVAAPFVMTVKGMSIKPFGAVYTFGRLRNLEPYMIQVRMGSVERRGKAERYFVQTFGAIQTLVPKDKFEAQYKSLTGQKIKVAVDDVGVEEDDLPF